MEVYRNKIGTSCLGPCRLSLVVSYLKTPILKCFYYLLWFYFLTDSEFSWLAKLAKPYPVSGPTPMPQIRVGKDGVYIRVTYIYAYCIARIQYSTRLLGRPPTGARRACRRRE